MSEPALLETPSPAAPPTTAVSLADLILVRLLTETKSLAPKKLRDDLAVFFRRPPTIAQIAEELAALRAGGLITPKGQRATDTGSARAMRFLGIAKLPPRANWGTVKAKYLVPKALGLAADSEEDAKITSDGKKLAAFLLKRKLGLPVGTGTTLGAVFEAIACRTLGYPDQATLKSLIPILLGKAVGGEAVEKDADKIVPRVLLDAKKAGLAGLREAALSGWADDGSSVVMPEPKKPPEHEEPFDLEMFARTVRAAARKCPTGRFGDNKVFINHVWNQLRDERPFAPLGLTGFKEKLVEANRANLLTLSRADLVQLMDPNDVRESETTYLTAVFHFILVERD